MILDEEEDKGALFYKDSCKGCACPWPPSYRQQIKRLQKGHLTYQYQPQRDRGSPPLNKKIYIVFPDLPG